MFRITEHICEIWKSQSEFSASFPHTYHATKEGSLSYFLGNIACYWGQSFQIVFLICQLEYINPKGLTLITENNNPPFRSSSTDWSFKLVKS